MPESLPGLAFGSVSARWHKETSAKVERYLFPILLRPWSIWAESRGYTNTEVWKYGNTRSIDRGLHGNTRVIAAFIEILGLEGLTRAVQWRNGLFYSKWIPSPAETLMIPDSQVTTSTKSDNHKRYGGFAQSVRNNFSFFLICFVGQSVHKVALEWPASNVKYWKGIGSALESPPRRFLNHFSTFAGSFVISYPDSLKNTSHADKGISWEYVVNPCCHYTGD